MEKQAANDVVSVSKHIGIHDDQFAERALDWKTSRIDLRTHPLYDDTAPTVVFFVVRQHSLFSKIQVPDGNPSANFHEPIAA